MSSGCGDVLSLEDLKTAKKHQLFEAEVITGKAGGIAGGSDIDFATNPVTTQTQKTLPAILRDVGFEPASFDFSTGGTLTINDRNKVVYDPVSQTWYSWAGALPKVIPAATNPLMDSNWKPQTDPSLRNDLSGDSGFTLVQWKPSGVAGAVRLALEDVFTLDIRWFGGVGDWNTTTQTGSNDTVALQNCVAWFASLGTRRSAGKRVIEIPEGNWRIDQITIPQAVGFGLDFVGKGQMATTLWFNNTGSDPAIDCKVEFINFRDMALIGALTDQNTSSSSWRALGFRGKLYDNRPDIDVKFNNCYIAFWQSFMEGYGRGLVVENSAIGFCTYFMTIVASTDTVFVPNSDTNAYFASAQTGMRHYTIRGCRFDVVSRIIRITGTGSQKDYINNILVTGNDFAQCDILIEGADATIRRCNITANTAVVCWATGVVQVKATASSQMVANTWAKAFDDSINPSATGDYITSLWRCSGSINDLIIANNTTKWISGNIVQAGGFSTNVAITDNNFQQAWYALTGNKFVFYSSASCEGLRITGNGFSNTNMAASSYNMYDASIQNSPKTVVDNNSAPWSWADFRMRYTPVLRFGGVASATALTAHGRYMVHDGVVTVDVMLTGSPVETSGAMAISLPVTAVAENSAISPSYSGSGHITKPTNLAATGASLLPIVVNPATQEAELWMSTNLTPARITGANKTNPMAIFCKFEYRY